jgi:hypothetical protein
MPQKLTIVLIYHGHKLFYIFGGESLGHQTRPSCSNDIRTRPRLLSSPANIVFIAFGTRHALLCKDKRRTVYICIRTNSVTL